MRFGLEPVGINGDWSGQCSEFGQLVRRELNIGGRQVVLKLRNLAGSEQDRRYKRFCQQPRQRHLRREELCCAIPRIFSIKS